MSKSLYSDRHKRLAMEIAEQRRVKGMTQADVAKALSGTYHQSYVAKIESGQRRVDLVELLQLAKIIDMDVEALVRLLQGMPDK